MDRRQAIERSRTGDERGFRWLFDTYRGRVFAFVRRTYELDDARAYDALQNTFVRAFNALEQLTDPDRFEPWLVRIARREALRVLSRGPERRDTLIEIEVECTRQTELAEQIEQERLRRIVRQVDLDDEARAAELLAARRALEYEDTPNLSFDDIVARVPVRRVRGWRRLLPSLALVAIAAAFAFAWVPRARSGIKGPGDTCAPADLRVERAEPALRSHPLYSRSATNAPVMDVGSMPP